jgi:hypothetical protein
MAGFKLEPKVYPLKPEEGVDDVCLKIKALAGLPFAIETITITKNSLKAEMWVHDNDPLSGDVPPEEPINLDMVMTQIELAEITPDEESPINIDALRVVADMLIRNQQSGHSAVAWVAGDVEMFCKWIGIQKPPVRFLEIPLFQHGEYGDDKLLLLGANSAQNSPLQARNGIITTMVVEEEEQDAGV